MEKYKIVPEMIDTAPKEILQIKYPDGITVDQGKELTPTQVKTQPIVTWNADDNSYYTLIMADPDSGTDIAEVRHWLVCNIPSQRIEDGEHLVEYVGSGPKEGTGIHRYVFLVFKQSGKLTFDEPKCDNVTREYRVRTSTRKFVEKYKLGAPVAGNFYRAQYDDYVPILHSRWIQKA